MVTFIVVLFLLIFEGFIYYWCGYLSGLFMTWLVGERIVEGLSYLGIMITVHQLPIIAGTLSALGHYFGKGSYNRPPQD